MNMKVTDVFHLDIPKPMIVKMCIINELFVRNKLCELQILLMDKKQKDEIWHKFFFNIL